MTSDDVIRIVKAAAEKAESKQPRSLYFITDSSLQVQSWGGAPAMSKSDVVNILVRATQADDGMGHQYQGDSSKVWMVRPAGEDIGVLILDSSVNEVNGEATVVGVGPAATPGRLPYLGYGSGIN